MVQFAKDEIRQKIIDTAREEFLEKGFEKASIRTITARAKTAKSNLYITTSVIKMTCSVLF
jgi:AcrR family transcriptional regulator